MSILNNELMNKRFTPIEHKTYAANMNSKICYNMMSYRTTKQGMKDRGTEGLKYQEVKEAMD